MEKVLLLQPERCIDCHSCELACSLKHGGVFSRTLSRISVFETPLKFSIPLTCLQCDDPACAAVCVVNALTKNEETGVVEYDQKKCIGCRMCVSACPFGNITYDRKNSTVIKCDVCGGEPECALFCPTDAIQWVPANQDTRARKQMMTKRFETVFAEGGVS
ncbi:MAG: 4Fe-4S dicluster domain-containing protein [Sediminispirochaetaceae bacterium]